MSSAPDAGPEALVAVELVKSYRARRVVDRVSFVVNPGEVVGLLGPNGAGKSTSFNIVVGLVRPEAGQVTLAGQELTRAPLHERARRGLGYLPQETSVFRRLTVAQNLLAVLELDPELGRSEREARVDRLITEFEIGHVRDSLGEHLSGGERRRLEIARCLAMDPKIVLLDEPFAGIDPIAVAELQALIVRLRDRGLGILITDHNVRETLGICTRAYILAHGRVLEHGTKDEIAHSQAARTAYLGEHFQL
ncbi:MAG: LPS export ABC transporter ATP-binding protein [Deltaproteobacteria bacterium]|nr:LPS export ABC transporter ATP-binding protein [Deltaproteobacteria bacterium]